MLLIGTTSIGQEINWLSFNDALEAQKTNPKKIFVDAYTDWCGPCKLLDKNTFHNKDVVEFVNENYYAVKFNAEGNESITYNGKTYTNPNFNPNKKGRNSSHELSGYFQIRAYPTMLFLDEEASFLTPVTGYQTAQQLEFFLKVFKTDDYKRLTTPELQQEYYSNFKPEFKQ